MREFRSLISLLHFDATRHIATLLWESATHRDYILLLSLSAALPTRRTPQVKQSYCRGAGRMSISAAWKFHEYISLGAVLVTRYREIFKHSSHDTMPVIEQPPPAYRWWRDARVLYFAFYLNETFILRNAEFTTSPLEPMPPARLEAGLLDAASMYF